jgi:hypothetical protein
MKNSDLKSMSVDELWELRELVIAKLSSIMAAERARLEDRLRKLSATVTSSERRDYSIRKTATKHGQDAASNLSGWRLSFARERN